MIYETTIPVSATTLNAVRSHDLAAPEFLLNDLTESMNILMNLLRDYEYEKEVKGVIRSVTVTRLEVDDHGRGSFLATYLTNIFQGCRDIDYDVNCAMNIHFAINLDQGIALLRGEETLPKRDPDEF